MTQQLAGLFAPTQRGTAASLFTAGDLVAYDPATGRNTVETDGATYTNLPHLVTPDLAVGTVLLAATPAGLLILGRLRTPV